LAKEYRWLKTKQNKGGNMNKSLIFNDSKESDLMAKWRSQGWIPPSEQAEYQKKWKDAQDAHWPFPQRKEKEKHD
jgi:hypothetical protein